MELEYGILYEDGTVIDLGIADRESANQDLQDIRKLYESSPLDFIQFAGATLVATTDDRLTWFEVID